MTKLNISENTRELWTQFLAKSNNCGHVAREQYTSNIDDYATSCYLSAISTIARHTERVEIELVKNVLEIGSSTGFNCVALSQKIPKARIFGLEPEDEAVNVARGICQDNSFNVEFINGIAERIPFPDDYFDLIICHTVIEHVGNVALSIKEMARVLNKGGILKIEAPNYNWIWEPHLEIFCVPRLGKGFVKFLAIMQGKFEFRDFVNHLNFVTPRKLESIFVLENLRFENDYTKKIENAALGRTQDVIMYKKLAKCMGLLNRIGLSRVFISLIISLGFYPSVSYTIQKQ